MSEFRIFSWGVVLGVVFVATTINPAAAQSWVFTMTFVPCLIGFAAVSFFGHWRRRS